jgi:hypothetical protein
MTCAPGGDINPNDAQIWIRRLFKVAEILSRRPIAAQDPAVAAENGPQKQEDPDLVYCGTQQCLPETTRS